MESEISGGTNQAMPSFVRLVGGVAAEVAVVVGGQGGRRRGGRGRTTVCPSRDRGRELSVRTRKRSAETAKGP